MKRALVTGSAGFTGRYVVDALRKAGYTVTPFDRAAGLDVRHDLRETSGSWDVVVHMAAVVGGRKVMDRAPLSHAANLAIDAAFFRWAEIVRPRRVVYFSSSCAYPMAISSTRAWRLKESFLDLRYPMLPDQLYGWAKMTGEMLASYLSGIPVTVVRPFSVYGPGMNEGFAVSGFLEQARRKANPLVIWGDKEQVRDYIHVSDVAGAVATLVKEGADGTYNLGTGEGTTLERLARMIAGLAAYKPAIKVDETLPAGARFLVADPTELHKHYTPAIELAEGLLGMWGL